MINRCLDFSCPNMGWSGCKLTACSKPIQSRAATFNEPDVIIFPQTIGNITFYSSKELIKWIEDQQKINKDPNYGVGNWA